MFLWDLSDYSHLQSARIKAPMVSVCVSEEQDEILVGCADSFLRAFRLSRRCENTEPVWEVANAHRGAITAVTEWTQFIVTGGEDAYCRVWHRKTRELLAQYCVHRKPISDIILDNEKPNLFHSSSEDKLIVGKSGEHHSTLGEALPLQRRGQADRRSGILGGFSPP